VLAGVGPDDSQTISIGMVRCKVCDGPIYYDPLKPPPAPENAICDQGPYYCTLWAESYPLKLFRFRTDLEVNEWNSR
jgi:hypothetical protein